MKKTKSFHSNKVNQKIKCWNFTFSSFPSCPELQLSKQKGLLELFYAPPKWVVQPSSLLSNFHIHNSHEKPQKGPRMEPVEKQRKLFQKPSISATETAAPILVYT